MTVLAIGYLSIQAEGMTKGYLFDWSGSPALSVAKRFPWEIEAGAVLLGVASIAAYWKLATAKTVRGVVLGVLIVSALSGGLFYDSVHAAPTSLVTISFVMGGASFFTLALIAGVFVDLILRTEEQTEESSEKTSLTTGA